MTTTTTENAAPKQARRKARIDADAESATKKIADTSATSAPAETAAATPTTPPHRTGTKLWAVVALLQRESGASLAELTAETGWLPHTVRATLTGLRKRGMTVVRNRIGDETRYTVKQAVA